MFSDMGKHASELSLEELAEAGAAAAGQAVAEAFAHGLAVTGLMEDDRGRLRLARQYPDGCIEWMDDEPPTPEDKTYSTMKIAG
jgi:hypothetical protein